MDYPGKVITKTQVTPTQTSASGNWTLDDQAAAIKNNNWPVALVPNPISKSLRFNSPDTAYFTRTPGSAPSNADVGTWSFWVKRTKLGVEEYIFGARDGANVTLTGIRFTSGDALEFTMFSGGTALARRITTQVFRDPSAWYHFVVSYQSPAATANDRVKVYVNGVEIAITAFSTTTNPSQNQDLIRWAASGIPNYIGNEGTTPGNYGDYYLTETNYIDGYPTVGGTTYDATSWAALNISTLFGLTNPQTGQWIPKKYTGTYGTNGFYLNFKDATSTTTLGYDYSGNANNWATTGFSVTAGAGNDSLTDVPTPWVAYNTTGDVGGVVRGNYCTLNPLDVSANTLSNGNLDITYATNSDTNRGGTIAVSTGKWYFEATVQAVGGIYAIIGVTSGVATATALGTSAYQYSYISSTGNKFNNNSSTAYGNTYTTGDVIGVALDMDNGKVWFSKNGTFQASGDPAAGTNQAFSGLSGSFSPAINARNNSIVNLNCGQRPFAYTPPAGFRSLCTTNLPATTIGFGLTNQGDDYFNTVLYTGNGTTNAITGVGFQPDFVWLKSRSGATTNHALFDAVRGVGYNLRSNTTEAEAIPSPNDSLTAFNSDGFTLGANANSGAPNINFTVGGTYVSWNWNAGGSNQTISVGQYATSPANVPSIASTVRANTTSGFSIVTASASGTSPVTVGHGCLVNGVATAPSLIIGKVRDVASTNWYVYSSTISAQDYLVLNSNAGKATSSNIWDIAPTSTVFTVGNPQNGWAGGNSGTKTYVFYCFAPVAGYSAFGTYTGNNSTDGPFIYLGFRPRFWMVKRTDSTGDWYIYDSSRSPYNAGTETLAPSQNFGESSFGSLNYFDLLSNGLKIRQNSTNGYANVLNATYIYAAFAESPFQFANAR